MNRTVALLRKVKISFISSEDIRTFKMKYDFTLHLRKPSFFQNGFDFLHLITSFPRVICVRLHPNQERPVQENKRASFPDIPLIFAFYCLKNAVIKGEAHLVELPHHLPHAVLLPAVSEVQSVDG